jgi:hypothetical protein
MLWLTGVSPAVSAAELLPAELLAAELPPVAVRPAGAATEPLNVPAAAFWCSGCDCEPDADAVAGEDVLLPPQAVRSRQPAIRTAAAKAPRRTRTVRVMHLGRGRRPGGSGPADNDSGTKPRPAIIGAVTFPKIELRVHRTGPVRAALTSEAA